MSDEPVESWAVAGGLSHHVVRWGRTDAPAVVLCHGFLDLAWSWDAVARRLARSGYQAIAFDWRGHGETEWIGRGGYYHFPDYVRDLDELLPQWSPEPVVLVGHSMGGTACAMYAGTRPQRIRRLVLVEGLGPPAHSADYTPDKYEAWLRTLARPSGRTHRPLASVAQALERMRIQNPHLPDELGTFLAEKATRPANEGGRVWRFDPMHRTTSPMPFQPELFATFTRRIEAPTLIVMAEHGHRLPDETSRAETIANRHVEEVPGVGHMIHWFAPEALADAMIRFVNGSEH